MPNEQWRVCIIYPISEPILQTERVGGRVEKWKKGLEEKGTKEGKVEERVGDGEREEERVRSGEEERVGERVKGSKGRKLGWLAEWVDGRLGGVESGRMEE